MDDVRVVEAAEDVKNGVGLPDVRKELVSEAFTLARSLYESGDVHNLHGGRHKAARVAEFVKSVEPLVGHDGGSYVRVDGAEGEVRALRLA